MLCRHFQLQNHSFHSILFEILTVPLLVSMLFEFVTVLDGFSHDQIHIKSAHDESAELRFACEVNQGLLLGMDIPIRVDDPDHAVIPGDVEMEGEEFEVGANYENPNVQRVPDQPSDENPPVESQSRQSSEARLPQPR